MPASLASEFVVLQRRVCHLPEWRSLLPGEVASAVEGTWLPLPPEVAQRLPGNAARTVETGTHQVGFSEEGEITPSGGHKSHKQHGRW